MSVDRIYIGTWLPRTHIHLGEIYHFLSTGLGADLDKKRTKNLHKQLGIQELVFSNNQDFNSVQFTSAGITVTITEDGVILLMTNAVDNLKASTKKIESFYVNHLGPSLAYLFSRGALLPQTLVNVEEVYPRIFIGENIQQSEVQEIFRSQNDQLLTQASSGDTIIFYGKELEVISRQNSDATAHFDSLIINLVFTQSYSDLLKRYLAAHRSVWADISLIKESPHLRYRDFPEIRNRILNFLKTISFIRTRLEQMTEILLARDSIILEDVRKKLADLGLESFAVLKSSSRYFLDLWQMTTDYANSTLTLFESLVEENTQREIRLLQQVAVAGMLVGFFGMNIAFPWEDRWPDTLMSSFAVVGVIIASMIIFYLVSKKIISNRKFNVLSQGNKKI